MCGIAGLVRRDPGSFPANLVRLLLKNLERRGPDDAGWLTASGHRVQLGKAVERDLLGSVLLVHRRLSTVDASEQGHQPMCTPDGRFFIVFNGHIANHADLRRELESLGHRFRSQSDTEVLLAAFAQWGRECLPRLVGMFAFAILDLSRQEIFLARDFFGVKPLYYAEWRDGFAFGSDVNSLFRLPGVLRRINPDRLYVFLRFGITDMDGETLVQDIRQVPPAHFAVISLADPSRVRFERFWEVTCEPIGDISFDQAAGRLRDLLIRSVQRNLQTDAPLGAALSGGIDSSSIVMMMRTLAPRVEIPCFSYIAEAPRVNEERWVDCVGCAGGVITHKVRTDPEVFLEEVNNLVDAQGECFGPPSIYAQYRLFQTAHATGVKVMLDGQGADEIFGGYVYYIAARIGSLIRKRRWREAAHLIGKASRLPGLTRLGLLLRSMDFMLPQELQDPLRRWVGKDLAPSWISRTWLSKHEVRPRSIGFRRGRDLFREVAISYLTSAILPRLLRFEDRNAMAFSIESRVPFLTPEIVEFAFALPEEYLISREGVTKAVLREAMRGIVPDAILNRRDKIAFETPESEWLMRLRPWFERLITSDEAASIPAFDVKEMWRKWIGILQGDSSYDRCVWRWASVILWVRRFGTTFA
jgi:asparagine synthase (glutamine-hydrolysing)